MPLRAPPPRSPCRAPGVSAGRACRGSAPAPAVHGPGCRRGPRLPGSRVSLAAATALARERLQAAACVLSRRCLRTGAARQGRCRTAARGRGGPGTGRPPASRGCTPRRPPGRPCRHAGTSPGSRRARSRRSTRHPPPRPRGPPRSPCPPLPEARTSPRRGSPRSRRTRQCTASRPCAARTRAENSWPSGSRSAPAGQTRARTTSQRHRALTSDPPSHLPTARRCGASRSARGAARSRGSRRDSAAAPQPSEGRGRLW
mmetsp:Transcript_12639/g.35792  ORF Transcript_12639/g.35792 Transcript_12639/m.35792 type:complete len:258 (+) Transcript_12639:75-848(+)